VTSAAAPRWRRWARRGAVAFVAVSLLSWVAHLAVRRSVRAEPPPLPALEGPVFAGEVRASTVQPGLTLFGGAYARKRGDILEVRLRGTPAEIGHQHARLLEARMRSDEGALYSLFERYVPLSPLRALLVDLSLVRYSDLPTVTSLPRQTEIAAQARAFAPDPFEHVMPTYQRMLYLNALYDIALSFEHSPIVGCTTVALSGDAAAGRRPLVARNFDAEFGPVFDRGKAVFLVFEEGKLPFASVAWPGLVGVMSGVNAAGLALVVHGGRAREPVREGEPVLHALREVLATARTVHEALAVLHAQEARGRGPMVPHMLLVADATGAASVIERAPGEPSFARGQGGRLALTNHFEGPLSADPKNLAVRERTSTLARRARADELVANLGPGATAGQLVALLRDKQLAGGRELSLGDRRSIDALIATHAMVADLGARTLWVSEGPHLAGRFVRFDLAALLDPSFDPEREVPDAAAGALPPDAIWNDGSYERWEAAGSPHGGER
jgi:isopenicillin-N N-acyltransferase-like protein